MTNLIKPVAWIIGALTLLMGILGFVFGSPLFGIFEVSTNMNIVYLTTGALSVAAGFASKKLTHWHLKVFGLLFGFMTFTGFSSGKVPGLFSVNMADNYLHLGISVALLFVGFGGCREFCIRRETPTSHRREELSE